jgi:hypothetical protein
MNNVFLDCGTHLCQGLLEFYENKIIDSSYKIYTFEANQITYGYAFHRTKQIPLDITIYNAAVWVENGFILFSQEMQGDNNPIGQGSSIVGIGFEHKFGQLMIGLCQIIASISPRFRASEAW